MTKRTIRELRDEAGLTQLEMAYRLGITPVAISRWERGQAEPKVGHLRRIADLFGVTLDDIALIEPPEQEAKKVAA